MDVYKKYKGKLLPDLSEDRHVKYIVAILKQQNVCYVGLNCSPVSCEQCVFCKEQGADIPPMEWFIEEGIFTKEEVFRGMLDSK